MVKRRCYTGGLERLLHETGEDGLKIRGAVDLHAHGIGRYDTRTSNPEHILALAELHRKRGTLAVMPTVYAAPLETMRKNMEAVRKAIELQNRGTGHDDWKGYNTLLPLSSYESGTARILGIHLEGPFLNPSKSGAMGKNACARPSVSSLNKLIDGYEDIIKIITIAPEMKGSLSVIEKCAEKGFRVNMGHSDATYEQALEGKKAGAGGITHIFNAMRQMHHREPGIAGLGLLDEDLYIEVIADGVHLHPKTIELIFSIKRLDRIMIVSDTVKGAGRKGAVRDNKGLLKGSARTVAETFELLRQINIPDAEIIEATEDNPARYIGLVL